LVEIVRTRPSHRLASASSTRAARRCLALLIATSAACATHGEKAAEEPAAVATGAGEQESGSAADPHRVRVKPVFLVPTDAEPPGAERRELLLRHVEWCRRRYRELLLDRDTFAIAGGELPLVIAGRHDAAHYLSSPGQGSEAALLELFEHDRVDRSTCPFVYVVLFCGTGERPKGGGAPINGGANTGGGIVILAADNLELDVGFQACLQHEIGHAFGLPHANAFGWDMTTSDSLMSYNPSHRTHAFEPSATPGRLLPEELRMLDVNERVFPLFTYDPARDAPPDYAMSGIVPVFPPMSIPGQPDYTGSWDGK
jgi:hypothetical protein